MFFQAFSTLAVLSLAGALLVTPFRSPFPNINNWADYACGFGVLGVILNTTLAALVAIWTYM